MLSFPSALSCTRGVCIRSGFSWQDSLATLIETSLNILYIYIKIHIYKYIPI